MLDAIRGIIGGKRLLLCVAAPAEARAVMRAFHLAAEPEYWRPIECDGGVDIVMTGIGKANAAGACARFFDAGRHGAIASVGVAGALPGKTQLALGSTIIATVCVFADEGVQTPDGFIDCAVMGFPLGEFPGSAVPIHMELLDALADHADARGPIATVSICSGTDLLAGEVAARTGAAAEGMEGAAVALVAHRLGVPMFEARVISNTTGDREKQVWDLKGALARLESLLAPNG